MLVCRVVCLATETVGTNRMLVPLVKLSTVGSRAFSVGPQIWNDLLEHVTSAVDVINAEMKKKLKNVKDVKNIKNVCKSVDKNIADISY